MDTKTIAVKKQMNIHHIKNNVATAVLCSMLFVAKSTLCKWLKDIKENGKKALEPQKRGRKVGSGRILSPKEESTIQQLIIKFLPSDFELNFSSWTRKAVVELVMLEFKKNVAERTIGDYLKRWNFTPQRPRKVAYQRDPVKVSEWLTNAYQSIKDLAKKLGAVIYFGDEAGIHTESFCTKSYAPIGQTPVIPTTGSRLKMNIISAIANTGILRFMTYVTSMNCRLFIDFMRNLIKSSNGAMVFLIVDNLRVHHGKMVSKWLEKHSNEIQLFFLPPYCPDLNPDEYFNHVMKQRFHSLPQPKDEEELRKTMGKILRQLQKSPKTIENLFKNEHVKYASKSK
jgi:transposase